MKDIKTQTTIERAIKLPSGVKGFPDREFVIVISDRGIALRKKGEVSQHNSMTWTQWVRWMFLHTH